MAPQGGEALENRETQESCPQEESERDSRLRGLTEGVSVACGDSNKGSHGDGTGEPENSRNDQEDKCYKSMVEACKVKWRDGQVDEDQQAPD